eukprot:12005717-Ditylum_brightwellii.AAC.1
MLGQLTQLEAELVKKDKLLGEMKEKNQKQEEILNTLCEEEQNQCKDMFCFDCLDNLNPVDIQVNARLRKQVEKETPWVKGLCQANRKNRSKHK